MKTRITSELYLRVRTWWAANDAWRWVPNPKSAFSKELAEEKVRAVKPFEQGR
jgi:hypothetical protein